MAGKTRDRLSCAVLAAAEADETCPEYRYEPEVIPEPYRSRRGAVGFDLYALYGIEQHDMAARKRAMPRNFEFFGAPVGLFFTMDRVMTQGNWLDPGMFMQNVMIVARAFGLETAPQQTYCDYGELIHR